MSKWQFWATGGLVIALAASSCERKEKDGVTDIGGKGGNATLQATPIHHAAEIDSSIVYIKYNATDAPATFDDSVWCVQVNGAPVATFGELKKGKYYFYSRGYDPGVPVDPNHWWNVSGGIPYTVQTEQVINISVPVTEAGH